MSPFFSSYALGLFVVPSIPPTRCLHVADDELSGMTGNHCREPTLWCARLAGEGLWSVIPPNLRFGGNLNMVGLEAVQTAPLLRRRLAKGHWARRLGDHHVGRRWSGLPGDPLAHSLTAQSGAALASEVRAVHR